MTDELRQLVGTLAFFTVVAVLYAWLSGDDPSLLSLIQLLDGASRVIGWILLLALTVRILYLPIQFLRHRWALMKERRRQARIDDASASPPARISALIVSSGWRDPHQVPWWQW